MKVFNKIIIVCFPYLITWFAFRSFNNGFMWFGSLMLLVAFVCWLIVAGDLMKKTDDERNN